MHDAVFLYFRAACLCVAILAAGVFEVGTALAASSAIVESTIKISVCGNSVVEGGEQCDGGNLNGASCTSLGFTGGQLSCSSACEFNTSQCTSDGGGGGGGGGGGSGGFVRFFPFLPPRPPSLPGSADFNDEGRVDITDLSILLYWWEKTGPEIAPYDLNSDGIIDIVDASILFYHWTG